MDANVFISYVVRDDIELADRALAYFELVATGERQATALEATIAEVIYALGSKRHYALARSTVVENVRSVLDLHGFHMPFAATVLRALGVYETSTVDFVDALNIAHAERLGGTPIVSFDRDYDRFPSVTRREP